MGQGRSYCLILRRRRALTKLAFVALALLLPPGAPRGVPPAPRSDAERIVANPNREPAGRLEAGVLTLHLEIRRGQWFPETDDGPSLPVLAFGEPGRPLSIPGPLIRIPTGTTVHLTVTNTLRDTTLYLRGMETHPASDAAVVLAPGASRELSFKAGAPGTYYYWAGVENDPSDIREADDSQLSGAFVVDAPGAPAADRVFVIGNWFRSADQQDVMVINGKSWPHTERFVFSQGELVRWRWINASTNSHPMHLHGFYYTVEAEGSYLEDGAHPPGLKPLVVTHLLLPTRTMLITWRAERAGNWIFHCHFAFHTSHFLALDTLHQHGHSMAGLVLGITVRPRDGAPAAAASLTPRRIRLLVQSHPKAFGAADGMGYVIPESAEPALDSIRIPGPLLLLRRGEPVVITIVNHLKEPTAVHWHGIELESYSDGVPGWSGAPDAKVPQIEPGDSFTARFTPPRAGTFIYHTHFSELVQMRSGLYGPLLVLEPGQRFDPERDRVIILGARGPDDSTFSSGAPALVNGSDAPPPMRLVAGVSYRFRLINIHPDWRVRFGLTSDEGPVAWRELAKDGADLPAGLVRWTTRALLTGPGETADFEVRFAHPGSARLEIHTALAGWYIPIELQIVAP
ncbi:MAG TPA: multicopper oxidase domain-containing protein [Gemmatimonadales bacterium]|nr:multicopper oxidase domain-containing protein [Gemmatimonadales bacterium]